MTHDEYLAKIRDPLWYGEQDANGVDLSLIRELLKLSPEQRCLRGDRARRSALELRGIAWKHKDEERPASDR